MDPQKLQLEQLLLHGAWLRRFAGALMRDEDLRDDLTQDTLIAAWHDPPPADAKPKSWLARVAQNRARDLHRSDLRRRRRERAAMAGAAEATTTPEQLLGDFELHRKLAALVTKLEEPFRQTVVLRYYDGLSAAQIGQRLSVPPGTIRWRLKEGLDRLRKALDAEHGGNRGKWMLTLAPLAPAHASRHVPRAGTGPGFALVAGAVLLSAGGVLLVMLKEPSGRERNVPQPSPSGPGSAANDVVSRTAIPPFRLVAADEEEDQGNASMAGPAAADPEALVRFMLSAIAAGSYEDFLVYADDVLKAGLDREALTSVAKELGPRLQGGYTLHSFGILKREAEPVHLWKLEFHDGSDDQLLRVTIEQGRARGFFIQ